MFISDDDFTKYVLKPQSEEQNLLLQLIQHKLKTEVNLVSKKFGMVIKNSAPELDYSLDVGYQYIVVETTDKRKHIFEFCKEEDGVIFKNHAKYDQEPDSGSAAALIQKFLYPIRSSLTQRRPRRRSSFDSGQLSLLLDNATIPGQVSERSIAATRRAKTDLSGDLTKQTSDASSEASGAASDEAPEVEKSSAEAKKTSSSWLSCCRPCAR